MSSDQTTGEWIQVSKVLKPTDDNARWVAGEVHRMRERGCTARYRTIPGGGIYIERMPFKDERECNCRKCSARWKTRQRAEMEECPWCLGHSVTTNLIETKEENDDERDL